MSSYFRKPQVMQCPACGATLAVPDQESFLCDYCGNRIIVPPELRASGTIPESITVEPSQATVNVPQWGRYAQTTEDQIVRHKKRSNFLLFTCLAVAIVLICLTVFVILLLSYTTRSTGFNPPTTIELQNTPLPTSIPFARLEMVFGSEGDQPGQLDDARSIAVDNQGNIFVADYTTGRISKFDSQGNFLTLIQVPSSQGNKDVYIFSIAADERGFIYAAADGQILKYAAASGELVLTIPDQWSDIYYESVVVAPDGNLYATNGMAGADDVLVLSPKGELLMHWLGTIENVNHDDPAMQLALGVDHMGRVYILSPMGNKVYRYNPDGTFSFSFGQEGDKPGQFNLSTRMLAITDKDYLAISDVYRVDLYDAEGNYLGKTFTVDYNVAGGSMYGMTIDHAGDLYFVSSGGKVLKFNMTYP